MIVSPSLGAKCQLLGWCQSLAVTTATKLKIMSSAIFHKSNPNGAASTIWWHAINAAFILANS